MDQFSSFLEPQLQAYIRAGKLKDVIWPVWSAISSQQQQHQEPKEKVECGRFPRNTTWNVLVGLKRRWSTITTREEVEKQISVTPLVYLERRSSSPTEISNEWTTQDHYLRGDSIGQQFCGHYNQVYPNVIQLQPLNSDKEIRGSTKSVEFIIWELWMSTPNFVQIHLTVVETFQPGPQWWIGQPTDRLTPQSHAALVIAIDNNIKCEIQQQHIYKETNCSLNQTNHHVNKAVLQLGWTALKLISLKITASRRQQMWHVKIVGV